VTAHVWRLDVIYPEGSRLPGFRPYGWEAYLRSLPALKRRRMRKAGFRWPRERLFLSSSGAYERAALLRAFGADVEVYRSDPVTWPDQDPVRQDLDWERRAQRSIPAPWLAEPDRSGLPVTFEDPGLAKIAENWGLL
jgi:hypothetical protein